MLLVAISIISTEHTRLKVVVQVKRGGVVNKPEEHGGNMHSIQSAYAFHIL